MQQEEWYQFCMNDRPENATISPVILLILTLLK